MGDDLMRATTPATLADLRVGDVVRVVRSHGHTAATPAPLTVTAPLRAVPGRRGCGVRVDDPTGTYRTLMAASVESVRITPRTP